MKYLHTMLRINDEETFHHGQNLDHNGDIWVIAGLNPKSKYVKKYSIQKYGDDAIIKMDINGKIFDPQNGIVDLKNKNVKFIGDPQKRIEEDYLRIIRFIRFKVMYDIQLEKTTIEAIKHNLNGIKNFQTVYEFYQRDNSS